MWVEILDSGKAKYNERYKHPLTGEDKYKCVTLSKDTPANAKRATRILAERIDAAIKKALVVTPSHLTLKELVTKYRKAQKKTVKKQTYRRNYFTGNTLMKLLGEDVLVNKLTAAYVIEKFSESGKENASLNNLRIRFKALIRFGFQRDLINDITWLDKFIPFHEKVSKKKRIEDKFLEGEEADSLLKQMEKEEMYTWMYLSHLMILTGWRSGEAIDVRNPNVHMNDRYVEIQNTFDPNNKTSDLVKSEDSIRQTYIQDELFTLMKKIQLFVKEEQFRCQYKNTEDLFFPSRTGEHLQYAAFNKYLKAAARRAGIDKEVTTHVLRHTHCSLLAEAGVPLEIISRRLGHSDSDITKEIYLHVTKKMKERENALLKDIHIV